MTAMKGNCCAVINSASHCDCDGIQALHCCVHKSETNLYNVQFASTS